ncbi:MAG: DNA polymerase III subunit delta [Planctomycetota bacterium]|jgi:DNA polymerase-3 subunit delta
MTATNTTAKKKFKPIYVLAGEPTIVSIEYEKLLDRLIEPEQRPAGLFDADPARISISQVLDELRTLPFLSDKRVVVLRGAEKFISQNRPLLEKYFDTPSPTGVLILSVSNWDGRTKLAKKLNLVGELINADKPKSGQLTARLIRYAGEAHNIRLGNTAAELLVNLSGDDLPTLYSELDKLVLYVHPEKNITPDHVESLIGHNRLFNCFNAIDAVITGNLAEAIDRLRRMFEADRSAEYTFVGAFAFHFRRMFNAKVLLEKGVNTFEIARRLGIWHNQEDFFAQLRKVSIEQLGRNLQLLGETDYAIKTGRMQSRVAAEQLVFKLAQ